MLLFIAFVVPGFVTLKFYELISPRTTTNSSHKIIDAIAYSCINYAILFLPIWVIEENSVRISSPRLYILFYAVVLLIAPVFWALLLSQLRKTKLIQQLLPHPTAKAWDYVFGLRKCSWVIILLKDGNRIGGRYGVKSFASSSPAPEQIYLEECWKINDGGGFERQRVDTDGILILSEDIVTVEFFKITEE